MSLVLTLQRCRGKESDKFYGECKTSHFSDRFREYGEDKTSRPFLRQVPDVRRRQVISPTGSWSTEKTRQVISPTGSCSTEKTSHFSDRFWKYGEDKKSQVISPTGFGSTEKTRQLVSPTGYGSTEKTRKVVSPIGYVSTE